MENIIYEGTNSKAENVSIRSLEGDPNLTEDPPEMLKPTWKNHEKERRGDHQNQGTDSKRHRNGRWRDGGKGESSFTEREKWRRERREQTDRFKPVQIIRTGSERHGDERGRERIKRDRNSTRRLYLILP